MIFNQSIDFIYFLCNMLQAKWVLMGFFADNVYSTMTNKQTLHKDQTIFF